MRNACYTRRFMLKRFLAAALVFGVFSTQALANLIPEPVITPIEGSVSNRLSGVANPADMGFLEAQIKKNAPHSENIVSISIIDPKTGKMVYANETKTNDAYEFSFDFIIPVDDGDYTLKVFSPYGKLYEGTLAYSDQTVSMLNDRLNSATDDVIKQYINDNKIYIGLDLSLYNQFTDDEKSKVVDLLKHDVPYNSKSSILDALDDATFNVGLQSKVIPDEKKSTMFYEHIDRLGDDMQSLSAFMSKYNLGSRVISQFITGKYSTIEEGLAEMILLAYVESKVDNVYDYELIFTSELFGLSEDVVAKYNKVKNKTAFFTALNSRKAKIKDIASFEAMCLEAVTVANKSTDSKSSGGGGGGGGGSTTSISVSGTKGPETSSIEQISSYLVGPFNLKNRQSVISRLVTIMGGFTGEK